MTTQLRKPAGLFKRSGVRYEVACDVIGSLISHYAETVALEQMKPDHNRSIVKVCRVRQSMLRHERDDLHHEDVDAVESAISRYAPWSRELDLGVENDASSIAKRKADFAHANASLALEGQVMNDDELAIQELVSRGVMSCDEAVKCMRGLVSPRYDFISTSLD